MTQRSDAYPALAHHLASVHVCRLVDVACFDYSLAHESCNDIRHGRHCVFQIHVRLVFVTKYRREVFTKEIFDDLRPMFVTFCTNFEAELVEFDSEDDHVHLLVNYPPKVSVSNLLNSLKGVPGRMIRKKNYPRIRKKLWGRAL